MEWLMVDGDGGNPHGPHRRACRVLRFFHVSTLDIWYVISKAGGNGKVIPHSEVEWSSFGLVIAFASSVFWLSYVIILAKVFCVQGCVLFPTRAENIRALCSPGSL